VDDLRLVERIRQGEEEAFAALFERYKASVFRYAVHMRGGDTALAEDVVQEVFLAFLRQLERFDAARGTVQAYLLGITRRQVLKQLDDVRDEESLDGVDGPSVESDPLEHLTRAEATARVRQAIAALPPAYREAIVLCELNDLDYVSAAAVMHCAVGTVRSRLHRARALLASTLAAAQTLEKVSSRG
jgi:RNA polymerase sigma-70 factor (ECF subfamily)